jgi:hypothetical protein
MLLFEFGQNSVSLVASATPAAMSLLAMHAGPLCTAVVKPLKQLRGVGL